MSTPGPRHRARAGARRALLAPLLLLAAAAHADVTERVSLDPAERELPVWTVDAVLSRDGRFVFFAPSVQAGIDTGCDTFFVRDLDARRTACAALAVPAGLGGEPVVSAVSHTGRFVVVSTAQADGSDRALLLWDRDSGEIDRIDRPEDGLPSQLARNAVSADGRFVAFVVDRAGRHPGNPRCSPNEPCDVLLRDRARRTTELVNVALDGGASDGTASAPTLSDDGRLVAFSSDAGNLVRGGARTCFNTLSFVCSRDVYLRDRRTGTTTKVVQLPGTRVRNTGAHGVIDRAGRYVDYVLFQPSLVERFGSRSRVFRYDVRRRTTRHLFEVPDNAFVHLPLSEDARWIALEDSYLGPPFVVDGVEMRYETPGLFVHDRVTRRTHQVDVAPDGGPPRTPEGVPISVSLGILGLSSSGRTIAFSSDAANLVPGDTNDVDDVFVRRLSSGAGSPPGSAAR